MATLFPIYSVIYILIGFLALIRTKGNTKKAYLSILGVALLPNIILLVLYFFQGQEAVLTLKSYVMASHILIYELLILIVNIIFLPIMCLLISTTFYKGMTYPK